MHWVITVTNPATRHTQFLTRRGVGEALWLPGPPSQAVRFATLGEAEGAAGAVRRARVGYCYVVAVIPEGGREYRLVIYTPATGLTESLDEEGDLGGLARAEVYTSEFHAEEVASLLRMMAIGSLYEVSVVERPRPWCWWLFGRLCLG